MMPNTISDNKSYYLVGSTYDSISKIDDFIKEKCIAIGFLEQLDFSQFMGANSNIINDLIKDNWNNKESTELSKIQSYFRLLSQIKVGDIVAVKSSGPFGKMTIFAYAVVVSRNGNIYEYDNGKLGHRINVDFIEVNLSKKLDLNYAGTLHQLSENSDKDGFYKVFGWYATPWSNTTQDNEVDVISINHYNPKLDTICERSAVTALTINLIHNRIQNSFIKYLMKTYPDQSVSGEEKDKIDAKRVTTNEIFIYEIKPFQSVYTCVREAIGQLLDYSHQHKSNLKKHIIVVGMNAPEQHDLDFINSIKSILQIPLSYIAFDYVTLNAKEFPILE